jgi:hypothetical protein
VNITRHHSLRSSRSFGGGLAGGKIRAGEWRAEKRAGVQAIDTTEQHVHPFYYFSLLCHLLHIVLHTCPILTLQFIWLSPHVSRRLGLWCTHFCSLAMVLSKAPQITKILITA